MDIRIGIAHSARELAFESALSSEQVEKAVSEALSESAPFIRLTDDKGRVFIVPTASFSYLEIGLEEQRRIGFVA